MRTCPPVTAFDTLRPPSRAEIATCVHCGFCLPTCPTHVLWGEEMDSPRGRIVLMAEALEAADEISSAMATHWDRCLGCMACVTACPSGVPYDRLIEATRPQLERNYRRSARERLVRRALFAAFTHPARMRALVPVLAGARRLGARRLGRLLPDSSHAGALARLTPDVRLRAAGARLRPLVRARGERRGTVGLLQGCVQRVFFHDVNVATAAVLSAEGYDVVAPRTPRCCGALMLHTGYEEEALALARELVAAFESCELVVVNAAGCGSSMRDYGRLLAEDGEWSERARAFSAKVRDVSELLAGVEPRAARAPVVQRVAYHDACHLAHAQGIRAEPRALLAGVPGLELVEPDEWEVCCGSAGLYNLLQPEAAAALGRRKARNLLATGAEAVVAGNPGCALQIGTYLEEEGRPLPVLHTVEILRRSIEAGTR
ncbi:MAG: 4Fe-4S dicluster domain-containing protein [Thermoleophilia bacterium]|nr:4Fe-4S dicluster domain-containing protein [Thermoleophilia bacterium]